MLVKTLKRCRTDNLEWLLNEIGAKNLSEVEGLSVSEFVEKYSRKHFSNLCLNKLLEAGVVNVPDGDKLVYELPITTRLKNILLRNDVYILSDIKKYSREDILRFRNLGDATMKELEEICLKENIHIVSIDEIAKRLPQVHFTYHQLSKLFHMHIWYPEDFCKLTDKQYEELIRTDKSMSLKINKIQSLLK